MRRRFLGILRISGRRGQATTEVVLLFPMFMFFLFAFVKVFALLIMVQKLEIASFYAARRWQLESHRNAQYEPWDNGELLVDIQKKVCKYIGYNEACGAPSESNFLDLTSSCNRGQVGVKVERTQVWNIVTVTACTRPVNIAYYRSTGFVFEVTKYVPNRDRPIAFVLPGLQ